MNPNLYVACIDLTGKGALVVGGGAVGLDKVEGLLSCGARVRVVARETSEEIDALAEGGGIELRRRPYESGDLDGCFLVVVATPDRDVGERVHADAEARSMLVNVADVPELCNFILPAIVRRPPLTIAITTAGATPALAKRMRSEAAAQFGDAYARLASILEEARPWAKETLATYDARRDFFDAIVNGDPDPIELMERGDEDAVRALIENAKRAATT